MRPPLAWCEPPPPTVLEPHGPPPTPRSGDGEPVIRFRNYEPTSEDLASLPKVEAPVIPEVEELVGTVRSRCRKVGLVLSPHQSACSHGCPRP